MGIGGEVLMGTCWSGSLFAAIQLSIWELGLTYIQVENFLIHGAMLEYFPGYFWTHAQSPRWRVEQYYEHGTNVK